jgi:hypothetical protein
VDITYFAAILRQIMDTHALTVAKLAIKLKVSRQIVYYWLAPKTIAHLPGAKKFPLLSKLSGISVEELKQRNAFLRLSLHGIIFTEDVLTKLVLTPDEGAVLQFMRQGDYVSAMMLLCKLLRGRNPV